MKQLRIYTLKNELAANVYFNKHWQEHLKSLPCFGIAVNAVYQGVGENAHKVFAIVTYFGDASPAELTKNFMQSENFQKDMQGFDFSDLVGVDEFYISDPLF